MKLPVSLSLLASSTLALAGSGLLGTKKDSSAFSPPAGSSTVNPLGIGSLIQMVIAVAIVAALVKWAMPALVAKFERTKLQGRDSIRVEQSTSVGQARLTVISIEGRRLLLGTSAEGVRLIAELNSSQEPETVTFDEMVETAGRSPDRPLSTNHATSPEAAMDRLQRLLK